MAKSKEKPTAKLKYEEAVDEIETIVDLVESGEIGLEESLTQYERGTKLISHCREILDRSQKKIAELSSQAGADDGPQEQAASDADQDHDDDPNANDDAAGGDKLVF